jgi:hypothetical protein
VCSPQNAAIKAQPLAFFPQKRTASLLSCIKLLSHTLFLPLQIMDDSPEPNYKQEEWAPRQQQLREAAALAQAESEKVGR